MPLAIIRHLPNCQPVLHGVVQESNDPEVDDQQHYMESRANDIVENFKKRFVEFNAATFYYQNISQHELNL
jgi:hypothetical protein